jgi:putative PIN family toxin of toxin-antitoxin system
MKVVVDTNIFLDAFFKADDDCELVLRKEHNGEFQLIMSHNMSEELFRMIESFIKELELDEDSILLTYRMLSRALLRTENIIPKTRFTKCEDKDDNMFFSCAIDGNANYIISKDHHIHDLKNIRIKNKNNELIEILYPDEFIAKLDIIKLAVHFNK